MPPSAAYSHFQTVSLTNGNDHSLRWANLKEKAIQIEVTQGTALFSARGAGGIHPTGCSNRCLRTIVSDGSTIPLTETTTTSLSNAAAASSSAGSQALSASLLLAAGDVLQYSGPMNVEVTDVTGSTSVVEISTSDTELVDP